MVLARVVVARAHLAALLALVGCGRFGFASDDTASDAAPSDDLAYTPGSAVTCAFPTATTTSASEVDVAGPPCTFRSTDDRESWLVVATARFVGSGQGAPSHLSLTVDGVEHAWGEPATPNGQGWQVFTLVRGPAGAHDARLRFNALAGITSQVTNARITAVPLGPASHVQHARRDGDTIVMNPLDVVQLNFLADPGDYIVLAGAAAGERPDGSGVNWSVRYPDGSESPGFGFFRDPLLPQLVLRRISTNGGLISIGLNGSGNSGTRGTLRDAQLLAFKLPPDASALVSSGFATVVAPGASPVMVQEQSSAVPTAGRAWFALQTMVAHVADDTNQVAGFSFALDGSTDFQTSTFSIASEPLTPAYARLVETNAAITVTSSASEPNASALAHVDAVEYTTLMFRVP